MPDQSGIGLLWIDTETTSISPDDGELLEIGVCVTDAHGDSVYGSGLYGNGIRRWVVPHLSLSVNAKTIDAIIMHSKNGLLVSCTSYEHETDVNRALQCIIDEITEELDRASVMFTELRVAGRNPQFDIEWLSKKMPSIPIGRYVSHRRMDMSALSLMSDTVGLGIQHHDTDHRVITCLSNDIAEYRDIMKAAGAS